MKFLAHDLTNVAHIFGDTVGRDTSDAKVEATMTTLMQRVRYGYGRKFDRGAFAPQGGDPQRAAKNRLLDAIAGLDAKYGDRLPGELWTVLAHYAAAPVPFGESQDILAMKVADLPALPVDNWAADLYIHSWIQTQELMLDVNTEFTRAAGVIFRHACCCSGCFVPATIRCAIDPDRIVPVTRDYLANLLTLGHAMVRHNMPFEVLCMENPIRQGELQPKALALVG